MTSKTYRSSAAFTRDEKIARQRDDVTTHKIDVSRYVDHMAQMLRTNHPERDRIFAILRRWQYDSMLDDTSQAKARVLVREFCGYYSRSPSSS